MGTGLLVTEIDGTRRQRHYRRLLARCGRFWVENGVIAYPVQEITIAGRLQDMYRDIIGVADERITPFVQPNRLHLGFQNDGCRQLIELNIQKAV